MAVLPKFHLSERKNAKPRFTFRSFLCETILADRFEPDGGQ